MKYIINFTVIFILISIILSDILFNLPALGEILHKISPTFLIGFIKSLELTIYYLHLPQNINELIPILLNISVKYYFYIIILFILIAINYKKTKQI